MTTGWQPIETAPRDGTAIILDGFGGKHIEFGRWDDETARLTKEVCLMDNEGWVTLYGAWIPEPTRWQSLEFTPPPEAKD